MMLEQQMKHLRFLHTMLRGILNKISPRRITRQKQARRDQTTMVDAKDIVLAVLGKVSNLLIQEYSDSLFCVEDQLVLIETSLRLNYMYSRNVPDQTKLREIMYDIEDVVDEFVMRLAQRKKSYSSVSYALAFHVLPGSFFHLLALLDLIHHYKIRTKLEELNAEVLKIYSVLHLSGSWENSVDPYKLDTFSSVISPLIRKFESLACQNKVLPAVRREARRLRDEFKSLNDFLKVVGSRGLTEEGTVWMEELCDVSRSVENLVGFFLDFRNIVWVPLNFISQLKLARKLSWIKEKILDLSGRRYDAIPPRSPRDFRFPCCRQTLPRKAEELELTSFDEDVDAITAHLLKDDPRCLTISIVGLGGIGKTELANLIYESQTIANHFSHRFWFSGNDDIDNMARILGVEHSQLLFHFSYETKERYEDRIRMMVNTFFQDKKSLIVVDNSYKYWERMGFAWRDISNGSRIIFTVPQLTGAPPVSETNFTYRLHLRSYDESWALFNHIMKGNIPSELQTLKRRIIRQCGGFPNAIIKLGEMLSQRDPTLQEWSSVLDQMNQDGEPWSQVLKEINVYLPLHLRRCLFYFGLFPTGYNIPARRLIALWVAEGLGCEQQNDDRSPEEVAELCLRELINYGMVQVIQKKINGKIKTCYLPDALRLHWVSKARRATFLQGHCQNSHRIRRLALDRNDSIYYDMIYGHNSTSLISSCEQVVSFMLFDTQEESREREKLGNFLGKYISEGCFLFLWVLDLENVYKPKLPKALGHLNRLKYLGLRSTYLGILPEYIDRLLNLQTLDLKRAHVSTLPGTIWKMQKLRHLLLDESFRSLFLPRLADSNLAELQTLWGVFVDEHSHVRNGLDTSLSITKLGLICKSSETSRKGEMSLQLDVVAGWIQNLKKLQTLKLKSFDESNNPSEINLYSLSGHADLTSVYLVGKFKNQNMISELPDNLNELTLSGSGLPEDAMQTLNKLPNLRILILLLGSLTGKKMLCSSGGFRKLEIFKLKKLVELEDWHVEAGSLPSLKHLEIDSCINLKMLPGGLQVVRTLYELKIRKLPEMSSRIKDNQGEDWKKIAHVPRIIVED